MKITFGLSIIVATSLFAAQLNAADGIVLVEKATIAGRTQTNQIQITKDHMRAEMTGGSGEKQAVVFDASRQVMLLINLDKKSYSELTKADADRMGALMNDSMAQMQAQLENLPPEQRARVEAMMRGRGMPGRAQPLKTEYRRVGSDKVGKWACTKYEGYRGTEKASEICAVEATELGVAASDFDVARQLGEFFSKMNPQTADRIPFIGSGGEQGFSGYPVRRIIQVAGMQSTSELVDLSRQSIPDSAFGLPAGFKKEALPGIGR